MADTVGAGLAWRARPTFRDSVLYAVNARFEAATYDLVLERDRPLRDDSVEAREEIERGFPWDSIDHVTNQRDSVGVLLRLVGKGDEAKYELHSAKSYADTVKILDEYFQDDRCLSWLVSLSIDVAADGQMTRTGQWKRYCHGARPAFDRWEYVARDTIVCTKTGVGPPGERPLCTEGLHDGMWLSVRFAQDTLHLGQACDGREVLIRRSPAQAQGRIASRGPGMRTNRGC